MSANHGARADLQPGTKEPVGPTRTQPMTNNQKDFVDQLNAGSQLPNEPTKGDASDVISRNLDKGAGSGSGAAPDNSPGSKVPTGPSAKQPATQNQKEFLGRLGAQDAIDGNLTKGGASDIISENLENGTGTSTTASRSGSGAAPDSTPGNPVPTGPSAKQPATNNQKTLLEGQGALDQLPNDATKGQASDIISKLGN